MPKCPQAQCGSSWVVCNGSYQTKNYGLVKRFTCRACGRTLKEFEKGNDLFEGVRFSDTDTVVLQAIALVALGLPLDQVEGLVKRKAETIQSRLLRCFKNKRAWDQIGELLVSRYKIRPAEVKGLSEFLKKIQSGKASFHAACRRKAATRVRPPTRSGTQRQEALHEIFLKLAKEVVLDKKQYSLSNEQAEIMWEQYLRGFQPPPVPKRKEMAQNLLQARIEKVLGCPIVVTPTGQFYRLEGDPRVARWLRRVIRFDSARAKRIRDCLTPLETIVFDQVRRPNQAAHCYALLEGGMNLPTGSPLKERMTITCMAQGLGMDYGFFISLLKLVADL